MNISVIIIMSIYKRNTTVILEIFWMAIFCVSKI